MSSLEVIDQNQMMKTADLISKSDIIPVAHRNKPGNVYLILELAKKLNMDTLTLFNNVDVIMGKPSFSAKFLIALANSSGLLKKRISFTWAGNGLNSTENCRTCTAKAVLKDDTEIEYTFRASEAIAEGYAEKKGSKYHTLLDLMLAYRSATFMCRLYLPELGCMMYTSEELEDVQNLEKEPKKEDKKDNVIDMQPINTKQSVKNFKQDSETIEKVEKMFDITNQFNEKKEFFVTEIERNIAVFCNDLGFTNDEILLFKNDVFNSFKEAYIKQNGKYDLDEHFAAKLLIKRIKDMSAKFNLANDMKYLESDIKKLCSEIWNTCKANPDAKLEDVFLAKSALLIQF